MSARHCLLALGAVDEAARRILELALSGRMLTDSASPGTDASVAEPFAHLPHEFWLPATARQPARSYSITWVELPFGVPRGSSDPWVYTFFDLALLASPVEALNSEDFLNLLRVVRALGKQTAIVAATSADTPPESLSDWRTRLQRAIADFGFTSAPLVWLSPANPQSADQLRLALAKMLVALPPPREMTRPRFWCEHTLAAAENATKFRGLLTDGPLQSGQTLVLHSGGRSGCLREVHAPTSVSTPLAPGQRLSLTIEWTSENAVNHTAGVQRSVSASRKKVAETTHNSVGGVLTPPEMGPPSSTLDVCLDPVASPTRAEAAAPFHDRERVQVLLGNTSAQGVIFLHRSVRHPTTLWLAQLRLERALSALGGDRLLVYSEGNTSRFAGARVLDPDGNRKQWQRHDQRALLADRAASPDEASVWVTSQVTRDGLVRRDALLLRTHFSPNAVATVTQMLCQSERVVCTGLWVADAARWRAWLQHALNMVDHFHAKQPHRLGMPLAQLRHWWCTERRSSDGFDDLVQGLLNLGLQVTRGRIHRAGHRPVLNDHLKTAVESLRRLLAAQPLAPPSRNELATDALRTAALEFLIESGEVVEVGPNLVLEATAYARAVEVIKKHLHRHGRATLGELRTCLGSTRRVVLPLCEKLQQEGIIRREGNYHRLVEHPHGVVTIHSRR